VDIHAALKSARETAGLTLAQVGQTLGITDASVSRMENRQSKVTTDRLIELAKLYKVSASALLEGSVVTKPNSIDLDRLRLIIEEVEEYISTLLNRPPADKISLAVTVLYKAEINRIVDRPDAVFDPKHQLDMIEAIFK